MSKVYESLKEVMQEALQRNRDNPLPLPRIRRSHAPKFSEELEELEAILLKKLGSLKAAVLQGQEEVEKEVQQSEDLIQNLRSDHAALENRIKQSEETIRARDIASQKTEQSLNAKIRTLEDELKKKKQSLQKREKEIQELKANAEIVGRQLAEVEAAQKQAKTEADTEAHRADEIAKEFNGKIEALDLQLREATENLGAKDSAIAALEQKLFATSRQIETQLKDKDTLIAARDNEISDLRSQLEVLTRGVKEMSSFFKQAAALTTFEHQQNEHRQNGASKSPETVPEKTETVEIPDSKQAAVPPPSAVSPKFFEGLTRELTHIVGPMAPMIIRDHVAALGESMESFPAAKLKNLFELLNGEIINRTLKNRFRAWFNSNQAARSDS
ncbi:MAG TPA: hypothetical protein VIB79_30445 [Candidatus Binatia bacterium]|jgi:chromosome segregation ATPase